jgi:hypothetical protein
VIVNSQPWAIDPLSLEASSTIYSFQAPFGLAPLNALKAVAYGLAGAGDANVSPVP